jgi:hypothetical protein
MIVAAVLVGCGTGTRPSAEGSPWESLPPGWSSLGPQTPATIGAVSVWTGRELFYWGGEANFGENLRAGGVLFDPRARKSLLVASGPLDAPRISAGAAWTGSDVFVWGGWGEPERPWPDGALFEPASEKWRLLPPAPLTARQPVATVWTGAEVIVWGDASRSASAGQREGAAYHPAANHWRELPPAPLALNEASAVWTGEEMVVFGAQLDGDNWSDSKHAQGIAYDPDANAWRVISSFPLSPQASAVAWTGSEVIAWDYELRAGAYDPARNTWRRLPDIPLRFSKCYPTSARVGGEVVAWFCGSGAIFEISEDTWQRMPEAPGEIFGTPVSAGAVVLFPDGPELDREENPVLWAFKP